MTHFKRNQAKHVKKQYKLANWSQYERGLENRGSITLWISEEAIAKWTARRSGKPGGQRKYSNLAIETSLTVRLVYHLAWRQTRGFLRSIAEKLGLPIDIPHHTTFSRRARKLRKVQFYEPRHDRPIHILVDSSGVKVHSGNMRKPPTNRAWRKFHLGVDGVTGEIVTSDLGRSKTNDASRVSYLLGKIDNPIASLSADSAYDTGGVYKTVESHHEDRSPRVLIPPKKKARIKKRTPYLKERNRNIRSQNRLGKRKWHTKSGYSRRALVENTFYRYKTIIGPRLRARTLQGQRVEARIGCKILNIMASLGMPESFLVE